MFLQRQQCRFMQNMFWHHYHNLLSGSKGAWGHNDHDCAVYLRLEQQWMISTKICFDTIIITCSVAVNGWMLRAKTCCDESVGNGGGGGGGGRWTSPPDFKLMLICVQAVIAKGRPKFIITEKREEKNNFPVVSSVTNKWIRLSLCATNWS